MTGTSHRGRLLVATPVIGDLNFHRTVVLLLEHNEQGALGLVLNRPTDVALLDPLPEWEGLAASPRVVFVGGPVEQGAAIGLAQRRPVQAGGDGFDPILGSIGTFDLSRDPHDVDETIEAVRVFAGYAGWGPDSSSTSWQPAWIVVDAHPDDILCDHPGELWRDVLRRQGGDLTLLSYCPPDPSLN